MPDFRPEFGRILATTKAKYLKKNSEIFSKKISDFGPKIGRNRPKTRPEKARRAFGLCSSGFRRARAAQKSSGRAGQARKPEHH